MKEEGVVVGLHDKYAIIKFEEKKICSKCDICRPGRYEKERIIEATNDLNANINDVVDVQIKDVSRFTKLTIHMFIPVLDGIIGLIIGYYITKWLKPNNYQIIILSLGLLFGFLSYFLSIKFERNLIFKSNNMPKIIYIKSKIGGNKYE